ncbi:metallophosphoesterase family protein [Nocardioides sp. CFH 31398]|uniref:purple acid phosphatase family protein n=1 Tax=Nocardioides sp. CFH 31398 TaxID=2919579 RepID=UPI001F06F6A7|nr:metallophosphoesterase family protein [Nocardioides sp. CFH 31398]MCH1868791.1 metallophosphoesterase family protein [Nocardioides sp. CFH 31398]
MSIRTTTRGAHRGPTALLAAVGLLLAGLIATGTTAPPPPAQGAVTAAFPTAPLLTGSATWSYLDDDSDPARGSADTLAWTRTGADATGWKQGVGPFGAKNGAARDLGGGNVPRTLLRHYISGSAAPVIPTYHFRTTFTLDAGVAAQTERLVATIGYDDGVRVYVNGTRVGGLKDAPVPPGVNRQYTGVSVAQPVTGTVDVPGDVLVDGVNTIAVAVHQAESWSSDVWFHLSSLTAEAKPVVEQPEVPTGDLVSTAGTTWRYLDDDSDPARGNTADPLVWTRSGYSLTGWKSARGSFGFKGGRIEDLGGGHVPTTLLRRSVSGSASPTIPTYHFRTTFSLAPGVASRIARLRASIAYDDGVRVYVNGTRVGGLDDGAVPAGVNRRYAGSNASAPKRGVVDVPGEALVDGTNVLSVALHQSTSTSSDVYLDLMSLTAEARSGTDPNPVEVLPSRVVLTPTATPTTSQTISWLASDTTRTTAGVEIEPAAGGTTRTVPASFAGTVNGDQRPHFVATVDGLAPGTTYRYRVGSVGGWSPWRSFTTAPGGVGGFSFLYFGDAQVGLDSVWPRVVAAAQQQAPHASLALHAGDLVDSPISETQWQQWFDGVAPLAATTTQVAAIGNHETYGDRNLYAWRAAFEFPRNGPTTSTIGSMADLAVGDTPEARQYAALFAHFETVAADTVYTVDHGGVRFVALHGNAIPAMLTPGNLPSCSGTACPINDVGRLWLRWQAAWLDHVLATSPSRWSVVTVHQPPYSASDGRDDPMVREAFARVIQDRDVDLVLAGHDHVYARGYDDEDRTDVAGVTDGPVYVIANAGGKHYRVETDPTVDKWLTNGMTKVRSGTGFATYQVIDVTGDRLRYRSYVADRTGAATTPLAVGEVFDEFTVSRSADGGHRVTEGWTP